MYGRTPLCLAFCGPSRSAVTRLARAAASSQVAGRVRQAGTDVLGDDRVRPPSPDPAVPRSAGGRKESLRSAVPVKAVVLGCDEAFRPGEVEPPDPAVQVHDLVLQHGRRQSTVDHHQPGLALHWRLSPRVRQAQQLADGDDPTPPGLLLDRPVQFVATAGATAQRSVQRRQRSRRTQPARHLNRRPCGRGRGPPRDHGQRCAFAAVHHQARRRMQAPADGVEHMQIRWPFGVEAIGRRGSTYARRDRRAACQIEPAQSQPGRQLTAAVDAVPNLLQYTAFHARFQTATGEECQCLGGGNDSTLDVE